MRKPPEEEAAMQPITGWMHLSQKSIYDLAEWDLIAGSNEDILPRTPRNLIHLGIDKKHKTVLFRWPGAIEALLGEETLTGFLEDLDTFAKYQPCPAEDFQRHALDARWLRENPRFDQQRITSACQGVWHFGVADDIGEGPDSVRPKADFILGKVKEKSACDKGDTDLVSVRDQMMTEGLFAPVTKATTFVHAILDPDQFQKQQVAMQQLQHIGGVMTTPDEGYSIEGVLKGVKTESHWDTSDVPGGLALLTGFGIKTGKTEP